MPILKAGDIAPISVKAGTHTDGRRVLRWRPALTLLKRGLNIQPQTHGLTQGRRSPGTPCQGPRQLSRCAATLRVATSDMPRVRPIVAPMPATMARLPVRGAAAVRGRISEANNWDELRTTIAATPQLTDIESVLALLARMEHFAKAGAGLKEDRGACVVLLQRVATAQTARLVPTMKQQTVMSMISTLTLLAARGYVRAADAPPQVLWLVELLLKRALPLMSGLSPYQQALVARCAALLSLPGFDPTREWLDGYEQATFDYLDAYEPDQLASVAGALAELSELQGTWRPSARWQSLFLDSCQPLLLSFNAVQLYEMVCSLRQLGTCPGLPWRQRVHEVLSCRTAELSAPDLGAVLAACHQLQILVASTAVSDGSSSPSSDEDAPCAASM